MPALGIVPIPTIKKATNMLNKDRKQSKSEARDETLGSRFYRILTSNNRASSWMWTDYMLFEWFEIIHSFIVDVNWICYMKDLKSGTETKHWVLSTYTKVLMFICNFSPKHTPSTQLAPLSFLVQNAIVQFISHFQLYSLGQAEISCNFRLQLLVLHRNTFWAG